MLKILKFVSGAVSKKDLVPYMAHFSIADGRITAYNGMIALSSPIPIDIDCKPKGDVLVKAITNCSETIALTLTDTGRLKVQSGKFKAFVECLNEPTPDIIPEGISTELSGKTLVKALGKVYDFIGDDASRPWANGVLLANGSCYATNNVCIIEHWLGFKPDTPINIPKMAIREILRIQDIPESVQIAERSITIHYESGRWIKSQLLDTKWPDIQKILNVESNPKPIDTEIFDALEVLKPFTDKMRTIHILPGILSTSSDLETGSNYAIESVDFEGLYNSDMMKLLKPVSTLIDWNTTPVMFFGDELRGAMISMRRR